MELYNQKLLATTMSIYSKFVSIIGILTSILSVFFSQTLTAQQLPSQSTIKVSNEHSIVIDYESSNYGYFFDEINKSTLISSITLKNLHGSDPIPGFSACHRIKNLEINNISDERLSQLFLNSKTIIENLKISNTSFSYFRQVLSGLKIQNLELTDCNGDELEDFIVSAINTKELKTLKINYCNLIEFPEVFDKNIHLQKLDISFNNLLDISDGILGFKEVDSIIVNGFVVDYPAIEIAKLKSLNPKYIQIDSFEAHIISSIKNELPGIEIKTVEVQSNDTTEDLNFGELQFTDSSQPKIYSSAYLLYPTLFNNEILLSRFDTTLFEARFNNLNYKGLISVSSRDSRAFYFKIYRLKSPISRKTCFNFYYHKKNITNKNKAFNERFPEMQSFKNMDWIIDDTISRRNFNSIIKYNRFNDIRLVYNPQTENFTLILKTDTGYLRVKAYPINIKTNKTKESIVGEYSSMHARYMVSLASKAKAFDKSINRKKNQYNRARNAYLKMAWINMYNNMSEEERKLSKAEWMKYYYSTTTNEYQILLNSDADKDLVNRILTIRGYSAASQNSMTADSLRNFRFTIVDNSDNNMPVSSIILLNKTTHVYSSHIKTSGLDYIQTLINPKHEYVVIGFLYDGSISTTTSAETKRAIDENRESRLKSSVYIKSLATNGQIIENLEL